MGNCAGIDWASEKHDVLIENAGGDELLAATFAHDEDGVSALCAALGCFDVELVAIERPDGLLVDRLLEAGMRVLALNPRQVAAARDRFGVPGGKSDRFDRFVLCELARTDQHRFRVPEPDLDATKAIRALTRAREDLVGARVALANQLRAELERFWPGPVGLFSDLDSPISLAFLARYPSPQDTRGLGEKRLAAFLKAQHYTNRKTAAQLLERLRSAPAGRVGERELVARRSIVVRLVGTLQVMVEQIAQLESEIADALDAHPDGAIFRSFFRGSVICPATLLSEIGDSRARYPHRDAIAADGGSAPSRPKQASARARSSAGRATSGCERRWTPSPTAAAELNPWAADRYAHARARGHSHRRALRTLGRAWSRIIWRCWTNRTPYDPARHTGLQQHLTVTIPDPSGPRPTSQPPSGWPVALSPQRAGPQGRARSA